MNNQEPPSVTAQQQFSTHLPWHIEPEIEAERQQFLRQRLTVVPDIQRAYLSLQRYPTYACRYRMATGKS